MFITVSIWLNFTEQNLFFDVASKTEKLSKPSTCLVNWFFYQSFRETASQEP